MLIILTCIDALWEELRQSFYEFSTDESLQVVVIIATSLDLAWTSLVREDHCLAGANLLAICNSYGFLARTRSLTYPSHMLPSSSWVTIVFST